jgi:hypothetical protein
MKYWDIRAIAAWQSVPGVLTDLVAGKGTHANLGKTPLSVCTILCYLYIPVKLTPCSGEVDPPFDLEGLSRPEKTLQI